MSVVNKIRDGLSSSDEGFDDGSSDGSRNILDSLSGSGSNEFDNINVVVRVKPSVSSSATNLNQSSQETQSIKKPSATSESNRSKSRNEEAQDLFPAAGQIQITDPSTGVLRSFTFDVIFEPEASQEQVFEHSRLKRFIDMSLEGFASTVFAYGQTGSGKTFTMTGNVYMGEKEDGQESQSQPTTPRFKRKHQVKEKKEEVVGLVQFTFAYLMEQIRARPDVSYIITTSFLEVYNEHVFDLLNPAPKSLQVRWSKDRGFYAENLFKVECEDLNDLEGVLKEGLKNRSVRSHEMNATSSRSHSLLTINLASETKDPEDPNGWIRREGKICLVDLAGSEKTKRTQSKGETLVEANNINKSLLVLGNCIQSLSSTKQGHIPYRDSILTKLLADSLSGSGMTLMIACVSALPQDSHETINTLRYASRAKKVKTRPIVRMDPRELTILSLKREVRLLRMENNFLRQQLNLGSGAVVGPIDSSNNSSSNSNDNCNPLAKISSVDPNLFQQYMRENESLRSENHALIEQRDRLIHDQEESDRALMKMEKAFKEKSSCLEPNSKSSSSPLKNAQQSIPDLMMVDSGDEDDHHNHFNKTSSLVNNSKHKQTLKSPAQIKSKIPHSKSSENVSSSNNKSKKSSEDNRRPSILFGWGQSNNDTKEQLEVKGSSTGSNSKSKNAGVGASSNRFRR